MSELNEFGAEVFDQTPVSCPIKFNRPTPLHLRIRDQILQAMKNVYDLKDFETEEEANDFDMEENAEFNSPYEMEENFDHITNPDPAKNMPDHKETSVEDQQIAQSSAVPETE